MKVIPEDREKNLIRWRLILGKHADLNDSFSSLDLTSGLHGKNGQITDEKDSQDGNKSKRMESRKFVPEKIDQTLSYLYDREYEYSPNSEQFSTFSYQLLQELYDYEKSGTQDGTKLFTIPAWINNVKELFPKETQEILINDAIKRYDLKEILTDPDILKEAEPSYELMKLLLSFRDQLNPETLEVAKEIIRKAVNELENRLKRDIETAIVGRRNRFSQSPLKIAKNLDMRRTIRHNLKYITPTKTKTNTKISTTKEKMIVDRVFFNSRVHKKETWNIIIIVDQSGSMLDSVIHSSILASIFAHVSSLRTNLVIFDTKVVDITHLVQEPVEVLMTVQLGGGTNIGNALNYANSLVSIPEKTIVVLITDFYEGGSEDYFFSTVKSLHESGVILLGLTAINEFGTPDYCKPIAEKCVDLGMKVLSITPRKLADLIAKIIEQEG